MNSNIKLNVGLVKGILKAYYLRNSSTTAVRILSLLPKLSNYSVICSVLENFISRGETLDFENLEREIRAYVFQTGRKLSSEEEILISEIKGKGGETYLTSLGTDDFDYIFEKIKEFLKYVEISGFLSSIEKVLSMQSIDADIDSSEFGVDMIIRMMQRSLERVVQVESEAGGLDFLTYDESSLEMRPYVKFTEESQRVMTGLSVIDNSITKGLGLQKGWFSVITAGTGIGKTTFLTNIAAQSFLLGYRVLYISLEMSKEEIAKRIDSIITGIPLIDIDKSIHAVRACQILKERISKAPTRTGVKRDLTIIYFPSFTLSVYQIPIILDEFKIQGKEFDVVIIDFADFFRPENKNIPYWESSAEAFVVLPGVARKKNVVILTATQVNKRDAETDDLSLASVYGSSSKTFGADLVIAVSKPQNQQDTFQRIVRVLKFRHGDPSTEALISLNPATLKIESIGG